MGKIAGKPRTIQQVVASYMNCSLASREILSSKCANEILELVRGCEPSSPNAYNVGYMEIWQDCNDAWLNNLFNLAKGGSHDEGNTEQD